MGPGGGIVVLGLLVEVWKQLMIGLIQFYWPPMGVFCSKRIGILMLPNRTLWKSLFFLIVVWLLCYHYHRNKLIIQIVFEKSRRWFCKKTFWVEKGKLITEEKSFLIFKVAATLVAVGWWEGKASQSSGDLPRLSSAISAPSCEIAFFQRDLWRHWRDISLDCLKIETFNVIKSIRLSHFGASVQKSC